MSDLDGLLASIGGQDEWSRHQALDALRAEGRPRPELERLVSVLGEEDATRRAAARMALAALASPDSASRSEAREVVEASLDAPEEGVRVLAASALGETGNPAAAPALIGALNDPAPNVQAAAADALGELGHGTALEPLAALTRSDNLWIRAAAIVALGRIRDARAIAPLAEAARESGLERPIVEALVRINDPSALPVLQQVHETAPGVALRAAGRILSSHPDVAPPDWVTAAARHAEDALRYELVQEDEPAVARLLGLAGTAQAVQSLVDLIGPPRWSEAAIAGILAAPPEPRAEAVLDRLEAAEGPEAAILLSVLPPLRDPDRIQRLVPLLRHEEPEVRAAAAEAVARAPAPEALSVLAEAIAHEAASPEVIRAAGHLGETVCGSLVPLLSDASAAVRTAAANALARCAGASIVPDLRAALAAEQVTDTRVALVRALAVAAGAGALDAIDEALASRSLDVRLGALEALGYTRDPAAVDRFEAALEREPAERLAALRGLGEIGEIGASAAAPIVAGHLDADDVEIRRAAARAAVQLAPSIPLDALAALTEDDDPWIRVYGARALAGRGEPAVRRLRKLADADADPSVRSAARQALAGGGG